MLWPWAAATFAALDLSHPDAATIARWFKPDENRNIAWGLIAIDAVVREERGRQELMAMAIANDARLILVSRELRAGARSPGEREPIWASRRTCGRRPTPTWTPRGASAPPASRCATTCSSTR